MSSGDQPPHPDWAQPQNPGPAWAPPGAAPGWAPPQPPAAKKPSCGKIAGIGCLGLVGLFIVIGAIGAVASKNTATTATPVKTVTAAPPAASSPAPAKSQQAPAPAASTPAPAAPATVLTLKGNGIKNSPKFTTGNDWTVNYTYDCSSFGMKGNFQVYVDFPDGDSPVNELGEKGASSSAETGAGSHSLKINSECDWTVTVTNG